MILDFDALENDVLLETDLCIIGGGIAGLTIAREFIGRGERVLVLEGGGNTLESESQALYQARNIGQDYNGHLEGRFRVFGGSGTRWGAQLLPLDCSDFEHREHVAHSRWPIQFDTLRPYYDRALDIMHVNRLPFDDSICSMLKIRPFSFDSAQFRYRYSKWARFQHRNLASTIGPQCAKATNIQVLLHASVTNIQLSPGGNYIEGLNIKSLSGRKGSVKARRYVLCTGTLETARLLLASNKVCPAGIGNEHGMVGRFFQDHISLRAAELYPVSLKRFTDSFSPTFVRQIMHWPRLELTPASQRKYKCLGVFGHVVFEPSEESSFVVIREILQRIQKRQNFVPSSAEIRNIVREFPYIALLGLRYLFGGRVPSPPKCRWYLQVDIEQEPCAESRVYLDAEKDVLGMPMLAIDWRPGERERLTASHYVQLFRSAWEQFSIGKADWNETVNEPGDGWLSSAHDAYHQAGTTRMNQNPVDGVVDVNLRVHGIDNLYVGGCAVFPCSGSANPTFTMMALCLRLADHLSLSLEKN